MKDWISKLKWQDATFAGGQIVLNISLLPSVFSYAKPAWETSLLTALTLCGFLLVYASYRLWLSFFSGIVSVALWAILFLQAI